MPWLSNSLLEPRGAHDNDDRSIMLVHRSNKLFILANCNPQIKQNVMMKHKYKSVVKLDVDATKLQRYEETICELQTNVGNCGCKLNTIGFDNYDSAVQSCANSEPLTGIAISAEDA
jgi:hypothetical protein